MYWGLAVMEVLCGVFTLWPSMIKGGLKLTKILINNTMVLARGQPEFGLGKREFLAIPASRNTACSNICRFGSHLLMILFRSAWIECALAFVSWNNVMPTSNPLSWTPKKHWSPSHHLVEVSLTCSSLYAKCILVSSCKRRVFEWPGHCMVINALEIASPSNCDMTH